MSGQKDELDIKLASLNFSQLRGVDGELIAQLTTSFVGLIAAHWDRIKRISQDEENDGSVKVAVAVDLHFGAKNPAGAVNIAYQPAKTKDGATFQTEDPTQTKIKFPKQD